MKLMKAIILGIVCVSMNLSAQEILIRDAKIYTLGEQGILERASILIRDGKIIDVAENITVDSGATIIEAEGKQITPGLFNAYTQLGVTEISAVSHTVDAATEDESFSASYSLVPAINPNSTLVPHNRIHGLTHAMVSPMAGHHLFAGLGSVVRLADADNFFIKKDAAVFTSYGGDAGKFAGGSRAAAYMKLRQAFLDAREYDKNKEEVLEDDWRDLSLPVIDLEVILKVLEQEIPLVVFVHRTNDITALLQLKQEFGFRLVLAGASEAWMQADALASANVAVIIDPLANLPSNFDRLGVRIDSVSILEEAGVKVIFAGLSSVSTHNAYLVRQSAGNAVAYGMSRQEAIKALTLNPAQVFGFADLYGSVEPGKQADLVLWDGDPLEILSRADQVIIDGKIVPMVSRSTRLRERYRDLDDKTPFIYRK